MDKNFLLGQMENLEKILQTNKNCRLFQHFEIDHLVYEDDLELIHLQLTDNIPAFTQENYLAYLKRLAQIPNAHDETILAGKNFISCKKAAKIASTTHGKYPLSTTIFNAIEELEESLINGSIEGLPKITGKVFHIFEDMNIDKPYGIESGDIQALLLENKSFFKRKNFIPHLNEMNDIGKSRYQILHGFIDQIEKHGQEIELIISKPQTLTDLALILSQRRGGAVKLADICPNLKVYAHHGGPINTYKAEIEKFLSGSKVHQIEIIMEPSGFIGRQLDATQNKAIKLSNSSGAFYSFVHESELETTGITSQGHTRLHSGEIKADEEYLVLVSNDAGILMHNTKKIYKVVSTAPLTIQYTRSARKLDHFGEGINTGDMEKLIQKVNSMEGSYGFIIREYMLGDDTNSHKSRWLFEINRPLQAVQKSLLQAVTNTIHTEMMMISESYKNAITQGDCPLPEITFIPMGTFSTYTANGVTQYIETDDTAHTINKLINTVNDKMTLSPEKQLGATLTTENFDV